MALNDLSAWLRSLKHITYGTNTCYCCNNAAYAILCDICSGQIERFHTPGEQRLDLNKRPDFRQAVPQLIRHKLVVIGPHRNLLKRCISAFKYQNKPAFATCLGDLLTDAIAQHYRQEKLPEVLLPMPMHPYKLARRGYNQTVLLSQALTKKVAIELIPNGLVNNKLTKAQVRKSGIARRNIATNALSINQAMLPDTIQHIALFDDVITTGSTMLTLIQLLLKAHPRLRIDLWSLTISL